MKDASLSKAIINKLNGRNVYFLWSGGDDSNLLLRFFLYGKVSLNCNFTIITIPFPQNAYSEEKIEQCAGFLQSRNIRIEILKTETKIQEDIPYTEACGICKEIRRSVFLKYYKTLKADNDLIITGHNLSDLMSYYIELCVKQMDMHTGGASRERFLEVTNKFLSSYMAEDGIEIFRPLLNVSQSEVFELLADFPAAKPLEIMSQKCFWMNQRKRLLQEYFAKLNIVSDYDSVFPLLKKNFGMPGLEEFRSLPFDTYLV